ncbi:radical SAM family heme chaperone HemW [Actinotalea fermentans]|uniref:Heme chaperone HemW n=1 Tax=Actinotalea fermentans TaxID=43671 RepID=A0A511YTM6_9CELL|nr:radical SAM family heme chaperone HemW [Actinotalea fermentans]KGM17216.1 coproporphyrinogen III oxidase [Actinotalea fermentans ATCC 43279 = JCM 9966 = DSM 3133]GEN78544.1 coproporphyrinogen III oxidase [Actinotalea fermentans]
MTPSALPDGEPVPDDGALPAWVADAPSVAPGFAVYVHVPFCRVRCGYCDFNTYTSAELGGGASQVAYAQTAASEIELARRVLADVGRGEPVSTVFFGGGTPTLLPPADLATILAAVEDAWGLAPGAEVTTEANPDSVTPASLAALAAAGFTRVSFGVQSVVPHVLATLDRTHDPDRVPDVVGWARDAGLAVSLDLIYGTPGESLDDWRRSLDAVAGLAVDHVSAYALVVEEGTRMGAQVRRGLLPAPDPDDEAAKYELADEVLSAAGLTWYEVSNWARTDADACRHNLGYWRGVDWWGVGPGAHSHVGGGDRAVRWWNVKHPRAYADRLAAGRSPAAAREVLGGDEVRLERVLLAVRLREGLDVQLLGDAPRHAVAGLVADGLLDGVAAIRGRAVLTRRGRLLADTVVRALTD